MSKERNRNSVQLGGESLSSSEWWKTSDEDFQRFLAAQALAFVEEIVQEKDVEERRKFALTFVTSFREQIHVQYPHIKPSLSDEALMQILLIVARKKVNQG